MVDILATETDAPQYLSVFAKYLFQPGHKLSFVTSTTTHSLSFCPARFRQS